MMVEVVMNGRRFGRKLKLPATAQIKQDLRRMQVVDHICEAVNLGELKIAADFREKSRALADDPAMRSQGERASLELMQKGLNSVADLLDKAGERE